MRKWAYKELSQTPPANNPDFIGAYSRLKDFKGRELIEEILIYRRWQLRKLRRCLAAKHNVAHAYQYTGCLFEVNNQYATDMIIAFYHLHPLLCYMLMWNCKDCNTYNYGRYNFVIVPGFIPQEKNFKTKLKIFAEYYQDLFDQIKLYENLHPFNYPYPPHNEEIKLYD